MSATGDETQRDVDQSHENRTQKQLQDLALERAQVEHMERPEQREREERAEKECEGRERVEDEAQRKEANGGGGTENAETSESAHQLQANGQTGQEAKLAENQPHQAQVPTEPINLLAESSGARDDDHVEVRNTESKQDAEVQAITSNNRAAELSTKRTMEILGRQAKQLKPSREQEYVAKSVS